MTWNPIQPRRPPSAPVTFIAERQHRGPPRPVLRLRPDLDPALAWIKARAPVKALLGAGEHVGMLRIERGGDRQGRRRGELAFRSDRTALRLIVPLALVAEGAPERPDWTAGDGWLEVELPVWCAGAAAVIVEAPEDTAPDAQPEPQEAPAPAPAPSPSADPDIALWTPQRLAVIEHWDGAGPVAALQAALQDLPGAYVTVAAIKAWFKDTGHDDQAKPAPVQRATRETILAWAGQRGLASVRDGMDLDRVNAKRVELGQLPFEVLPPGARA
jgi:hypothetical protein